MQDVLAFGLNEAVPADADVAWGARLIITMDGHVDLPPDRQSVAGTEGTPRDVFLDQLQSAFAKAALFTKVREMIFAREIDTRVAGQVTIFEGGGFKVVGDTKASAGYLYVAAFQVPS